MIDLAAHQTPRTEDSPPGLPRDEDTLSLAEAFRILRRRIWLIVAIMVAVLGLGLGYSLLQPASYQASTLVIIGQAGKDDPQPGAPGIQFEVEGLKALAPTMAEAAVSRPVVDAAIGQSGLTATPEEVSRELQAEPVANTLFIRITYADESALTALRFVNAVASRFALSAPVLDPLASPIRADVWQPAVLPTEPVGPNIAITVILALVAGSALGVLAAFLLEGLSNAGVLRRRAR